MIEQQLTDLSTQLTEAITLLKALNAGPVADATEETAQIDAVAIAEAAISVAQPLADTPVVTDKGTIPAGGTVVAPEVLQLTKKAVSEGYSFDAMYKVGWTDKTLVENGYAEYVSKSITADDLNVVLATKAGAMGDEGAAIYKLLKDKYKVNGVKELDEAFYPKLKAEVEAL